MRLFDKIMRHGDVTPEVKNSLKDATVVVLDEVARYLFMETPQESWDFLKDFPNVAPPFEYAFYEARSTPYVLTNKSGKDVRFAWPNERPNEWAVECVSEEVDWDMVARSVYKMMPDDKAKGETLLNTLIAQHPKWMIHNFLWTNGGSMNYGFVPWWFWTHLITEEGKFVVIPAKDHPTEMIREELASYGDHDALWILTGPTSYTPERVKMWLAQKETNAIEISRAFAWVQYIQFMGVCLMHCQNTEVKPVEPPAALVRKHLKRYGGPPLTTYKTLVIGPTKKIINEHRTGEVKDGIRLALHKCRGHFKTYRQHGLFGKVKGMYWWREHSRGDASQGKIVKDYKVEAKDESASPGSTVQPAGDRVVQRVGPLVRPAVLAPEEKKDA